MTSILSYEILSRKNSPRQRESQQICETNTACTVTNNKQQCFEGYQRNIKFLPSQSYKNKKDEKCTISMVIDLLALPLSSIFSFLYANVAMVELHLGWQSHVACHAFYQLAIIFYSIAIFFVYVILWERQRRLYNIKAIKHLSNHILQKLSLATLLLIVATNALSIVVLNLSVTTQSTREGCFRIKKHFPRFVRAGILPAINVVQQVSIMSGFALMLSFQYPETVLMRSKELALVVSSFVWLTATTL